MASPPTDHAVIADPVWIAHRYDWPNDAVHFRHVPRDAQAGFPFLIEDYLGDMPAAVIDRRSALAATGTPAPLHFIFHSAFCASTLLCRALDHPGLAMGLSEPTILNDIVGIRRRREADGPGVGRLLDDALRLLSRPWGKGEAVVIKPSNILNPLAPGIMALRPDARAVLLYAPLPVFIASVARKGMWCRLWARELLQGLITDGIVDLGFSPDDYFRLTDLQVAAVGWLAQHRLFHTVATRFGADRIATLDSETLVTNPGAVMSALGRLFALPMSGQLAATLASGPAFTRHSKFGQTFDATARDAERASAHAAHGDEIAKVAEWATVVGGNAGVAITLPHPAVP